MLLCTIAILALCVLVDMRYSLYYTDCRPSSYSIFDCLYAYIIVDNMAYIRNCHLTSYCRRLDDGEKENLMFNIQDKPKTHNDGNDRMTSRTCYRFVANCNHELWPLCLDWREICDGKIDYRNGKDEHWCEQLETTKRSDYDEYRCHYGGQYIPRAFKRDNHYSSDYLDGSDEKEHYSQYTRTYNIQCKMISTFSCEKRISRLTRSFQCGNSVHLSETILPNYSFYCDNQRDKEISRFYSPWLATNMSLIVFEGVWNKECEP
ncbi:unnamed protein product [Rotaria magnacalcarata]